MRRIGPIRPMGPISLFVAIPLLAAPLLAADWPQWRGPDRDGRWNETGIIDRFPAAKLTPRWTSPVGPGYTGPTVAGERVYLMDRQTQPKQVERVLCFERETGRSLWAYPYDCPYKDVQYTLGPRASVTIDDGRAYSLGTMGHLQCLDAAKGTLIWGKDLAKEYKLQRLIWGISASPLVDGDRVIVQVGAADGACLVAFDKKTGAECWRAGNDRPSYSAPILIQQAGKRVLVCWTKRTIVGLDPETGRAYWEYLYNAGNVAMNVATPIVDRNRLFVSAFFDGSIMLKLSGIPSRGFETRGRVTEENELKVDKLWQRRGESITQTDSLHSTITTDYIEGDYVYGIDSFGQLRCLKAENGDRVWESLTVTPRERWGTVHLVRQGDRTWLFTERGDLIIAKLTPAGYEEISRAKLIEPTTHGVGRLVCWSHPAFAYRHVFARNDRELVCVSLAQGD